MIYSEVNKKKKENEDMDLSDLMSFDDFISNSSSSPSSSANKPSYTPPSRGKKKRSSSNKRQKKAKPPELNVSSHSNTTNLGKVSKDMEWTNNKSKPSISFSMKLSKEEIVKSFIFSEVLRRYDINRIYDRIPGVNRDE